MKLLSSIVATSALLGACSKQAVPAPEAASTSPAESVPSETESAPKSVTETTVEEFPELRFEQDTTFAEGSEAALAARANALRSNQSILLTSISAGAESLELSEARGAVVIAELVKLGVPEERLKNQPVETDDAVVEMKILDYAKPTE